MKLKLFRYFILLFSLLVFSGISSQAYCAEISGADFLKIEPSARAMTMGSGYAALTNDVFSVYYNPAGLSEVATTQFGASHNEWMAGLSQEYFGLAGRRGKGSYGVGIKLLHRNQIERNEIGAYEGDFTNYEGTFSLGYGYPVGKEHSLGLNLKYVHRKIYDKAFRSYALDLGYQYRHLFPDRSLLALGSTVKNLGPKISFEDREYKLPRVYEFSAAYGMNFFYKRQATFNANWQYYEVANEQKLSLGVDFKIAARLHIRGAYFVKSPRNESFRLGLGFIQWKIGRIDYAFTNQEKLSNTHLISLMIPF